MSDFEETLISDTPRGLSGKADTLVEARWLTPDELDRKRWGYRNERGQFAGPLLGYRRIGNEDVGMGSLDKRHILTVAGSRSGKGVLLIANLLLYDGSVLAIDPKGELARITARARKEKGQKVVVLDPYGENGRYATGSFNPLKELDPKSVHVKDDAGAIADALIIGNERDPHWTDSARILIKALILYTLTLPEAERSLITVWKLISLTHPKIQDVAKRAAVAGSTPIAGSAALFILLKACKGVFDDSVAGTGERFSGMAERELASVFSTALTQLEFLDSKAMSDVLQGNDFNLSDLKTGKTTVYLCLPATKMGTHSRWLRVIINLALAAFEREKTVPNIPVLMMLDEFAVLGHMKSVETAAGLVAGFGVKLWVVLQDLSQLRRHYKESYESFTSNAGIVTLWANSDEKTLKYISERLGQTSVRIQQPTGATPGARLSGASGIREELRVQRLLAPDEAERFLDLDTRRVLVLAAGKRPVILKRPFYYADPPFAGKFDT